MARRAIHGSQLKHEDMNTGQGYRVKFSYGVFSIAPKVTQSGTYYYATKRHQGRLFKVYVGKCGEVTHDLLHQATMALQNKAISATGRMYPRDNQGHGA